MHMITINDGLAKIQDGTLRLVHVINIEQYENLLTEIRNYTELNLSKTNFFYPLLSHEFLQTQEILETIKPNQTFRNKRALNFIGTAWKYLAGSPDHDDFEIVSKKINNIIENNNKQVVINKEYNERINNITKITNQLENFLKKDATLNDEIALNIQYRLRLIKEELLNIKYAIQLARIGIINSILLNKYEMKLAIETLNKEKIPFTTIEEALEFAHVNILSNGTTLLYVIKIPLTFNTTYNKIIIKPVKKYNVITRLSYNEILQKENEIYGIQYKCRKYNLINICKQSQLVDISNTSCIPRLIRSLNSSCTTTNAQHIPTIEEIQSGVLLLNQFNGNITINNLDHDLNGTYLLKFHNTSVKINNQYFRSFEASSLQIMPAVMQPTPQEKGRINLLSLESLSELHLNNTKEIQLLYTEGIIQKSVSFGAAVILAIIMIIIYKMNKKKTVIIEKHSEAIKIKPNSEAIKIKPNSDPETDILPIGENTNNNRLTLPNIYAGQFF